MSGMPDKWRREFQLYARLSVFQHRVEIARKAVAAWLSEVANPYIAYSSGKDSTCVLRLVREQAPDTPAVYFDAECSYPESEELIRSIPNLIRWSASEPLLDTIGRMGLFNHKLEEETMRTTVYEPAQRLVERFGFDGMAYGLRAEESRARSRHRYARGLIFKYKARYENLLACQPLGDWTYQDVWAFIVAQGLEYCPTYDLMWNLPERERRISYWAGETNRSYGRYTFLKRNYPALWSQLVTVAPEVTAYV